MKWAQRIQKPVFATIQYFILLSLSLDCSSLSNRTRAVSLLNSRRYENDVILLLEWLDSISTIKTLERNQTSAPTAAHAATTAEAATTAHTTTPYETAKAITTAVEAAAIDSNNQQVFLKAIIFYLTIR